MFLVGGGETDRDLYNKLEVNMNFDEKITKDRNLRLQRGNRTYRRDMSTPKQSRPLLRHNAMEYDDF